MAASTKTGHTLERLVFFSDAVFAIAITLLVIEIHAPHLPHGAAEGAYWQALAQLWPKILGYIISFAVIGLFWMGHHRAFALSTRYSPKVLGWNLGLLGTIGFMPFATAFLSSNMNAQAPAVFYCVVMLLAAFFNWRVVRVATGPDMAEPSAGADAIAYVRARSVSVLLGAATALALSFVLPQMAQVGLVTIPLWLRLLRRGRTAETAA